MGDDPAGAAGQLDQILVAREDAVVVARRLGLVGQEPLELEATARTAVSLALADSDVRPAAGAAELDRGEALLQGIGAHALPFGVEVGFLLPLMFRSERQGTTRAREYAKLRNERGKDDCGPVTARGEGDAAIDGEPWSEAPASLTDCGRAAAGTGEGAMEREVEFLRQQVEYLERMLETSMARISSLEARVAELERRPVAIVRSEEPDKPRRGHRLWEEELVLAHSISFWESHRGPKRG
jgi:hypothetical protein